MPKLTPEQRQELEALRQTNDTLNQPIALMRFHWHDLYRPLALRGLVKWGNPPTGFNRLLFAGVTITPRGRATLGKA